MAVDMFIKIGDIKGEAQDKTHTGEIDVLAWSWGMSNPGSAHVGAGAGSGKVNVNDLTFTKYVDRASPALMQACCSGKHYDEALLTVRKAGDKPIEYLKIKVGSLLVSSISTGGSGGDDRLTENVTLNFGKVHVDYTPQKHDGTADTPVPMDWDIAKNVRQ